MTGSSSTRPLVLRDEIESVIDSSLRASFPNLSVIAEFVTVKGDALEKYGDDYQCPNVIDICEQLRVEKPNLFQEKGTKKIAKVVMKNLQKFEMIQQVSIRGGCLISFKLSREWIDNRICSMLKAGIHTWAPIYNIKSAVLQVPTPAENSDMYADPIRSGYILDTLDRMFEYSGVDVRYMTNIRADMQSHREIELKFAVDDGEFKRRESGLTAPTPLFVWRKVNGEKWVNDNNVCIDLRSLWYAIHVHQAGLIVYITPARQREYIEKCIDAARDVKWLGSNPVRCRGYLTSSNEKEKLACLVDKFRSYPKAASLVELGKAIGYIYTPEGVFECALRYTYLKNHRSVDCKLSLEEMLDVNGNTFVYLLNTRALVYSSMKNPRRMPFKLKKELAAKERDLGLHIVRFTDVVEESCAHVLPHLMCEYLCELCKKFTSCYSEVPPVNARLFLCEATALVMEKCFHLLKITPEESCRDLRPIERFLSSNHETTLNHFIPWPFSVARPENPRLEMFSMFVSLEDKYFEDGSMFGSISVSDVYGLLPDGWSELSGNDTGFVSYFERDWFNPMRIKSGSFRSIGNPGSRHAVAFSPSTEIRLCLAVTSLEDSKSKDACYICESRSKDLKKLKKFCEGDLPVECDYLSFRSKDAFVRIYYILMRDAVDMTMEIKYVSPVADLEGVKIRGHVYAFYEGVLNEMDVLKKMCYKAVVFKTNGARIFGGNTLDLDKSVLSVPANSRLMIEAFLQDVTSGEVIVDQTLPYQVMSEGSTIIEWKMPVGGKRVKKGFILALNWSKGAGVNR